MKRIVVVGAPGSGKSTLSRFLGQALQTPVHERDALGPLGSEPYRQNVTAILRTDSWILDGFPYFVDTEVYSAADTVIALDYPRRIVLWRVIVRSLRLLMNDTKHGAHRREGLHRWFCSDHAVRVAFTRFGARRAEMRDLPNRPELNDATILRFTSPSAARAWLASPRKQR